MKSQKTNLSWNNKLFIHCSKEGCQNIFSIYSPDFSILEVRLGKEIRIYEYCCKKHLEEQLVQLNSKATEFDIRVKIDKTEILCEKSPFKMRVFLSEELKKIDVIYRKEN